MLMLSAIGQTIEVIHKNVRRSKKSLIKMYGFSEKSLIKVCVTTKKSLIKMYKSFVIYLFFSIFAAKFKE